MRQIVYNSVKCLECNEVLVSRHRHDYVTCGCPNDAMADGGNEYERYGAMDMDKIETHYVYADDDFEIVRKYAVRGSRGKYGETPLTCKLSPPAATTASTTAPAFAAFLIVTTNDCDAR